MPTIDMQTQYARHKRIMPWLTVVSLRRSLIHKPLAVLMSILLLPALTWMESGGSSARPFTAQAQGIQGCTSTTNSIIQSYCVNGVVYYTDLVQFESDSVSAYLALHNLPQTDTQLIYSAGRTDLRTAVRGVMLSSLLGIIQTAPATATCGPPNCRSTHQQNLFNWLQALVQTNETNLYTNAINQFQTWEADPCTFALDSAIATAYNLSYDGSPYCFQNENEVIGAKVPSEDYFTAYGLKTSYGALSSTLTYFGSLVTNTSLNVGEVVGISSAASAVVTAAAAAVSAPVFTAVSVAVDAFVVAGSTGVGLASEAGIATIVSGATASVVGGAAVVIAAPVLIVLAAVAIGITAGIELFDNIQQINTINTDLTNGLNNAKNPPDLQAMAIDTSGTGYYKLEMTLDSQTTPEQASTATLPVHQPATDYAFNISGTISDTLTYQDWVGNIWTAQTSGGWFVQTCANGTGGETCPQPDSLIGSFYYVDGSGVDWTASRVGNTFVSTKASPNSTDVPCPANLSTGVTPNPNPATCSSYVSSTIPLKDGNGNLQQVSLSVLTVPVFTGPTTFSFAPDILSTQTITAVGNPTPNISFTSGNLPSDFKMTGGSGTFQLQFDGNPFAQGNFTLVLTASSSSGSVQQTFSINVTETLAIVSPNSINVGAGMPITPFTVVTTGQPTPSLSIDRELNLGGLTFTDNHNGTATISGTWTSPLSGPNSCINPNGGNCGIIASNNSGSVEQQFTINVAPAAPAVITGCPLIGNCTVGATFIAGISNTVQLSATAPTGIAFWELDTSNPTPPSWINLADNGNGTAQLFGNPPVGTSGTFYVGVSAFAVGSAGGGANYPITVVTPPVFTNGNNAAFTVGTNSSFGVEATQGTISLNGTPPQGLSFTAGNTGTISGTPAVGTGGQYDLSVTANAGAAGSATEALTVDVYEAPQISSANSATMFVGTPGMFAVTTTGFPSASSHAVPGNPAPPTDPSQGDGMYFTITGLPSDLSFSNLNASGFATGTLTIQGTPSAADVGTHTVQITATNAVGTTAQQTLTLKIVKITGAAPASGTKCNGNYNGTFKGAITVTSGQNCAFYAGGVTGKITVNGGHLALTNATVTGGISIQGSSGFSIGPGSTIGGTLTIESVASGSAASRMCETNVNGNVLVSSNAIPILIGSPQNTCFGNTIGGSVQILSNTSAVSFFDNTVTKSVACSLNHKISGGGDTAQKLGGQCAAF